MRLIPPPVPFLLAPVQAQGLAPGTRVRVTAGDDRTSGLVTRSTADSLAVDREVGGLVAFAWAEVERVEHTLGRRGSAGRGALIGAGVMGAASVAAFALDGDAAGSEDWSGAIALVAIPANSAVGAGRGALVGLAWRSERWGVLPVGAAATVHPTGLGVAVRL
ncbi:MAG: hypothetical protein R3181_05630 [Rubricoccaceae bacterium]|nr:hypothetical protein [Rubricoccaceae bacterium]